jgi:hypothetical protein
MTREYLMERAKAKQRAADLARGNAFALVLCLASIAFLIACAWQHL